MTTLSITMLRRRAVASVVALSLGLGVGAEASVAATMRPLLAGHAPSDRGDASDVPRWPGLRDLGAAPAGAAVRIGVLLRYQHEAELESLVRLQGQRGSAYYHHYLTAPQWNAYFAPAPAQVAKVALALRRAGFLVDAAVPANRGLVLARGRVAAAQTYFHTRIDRVMQDGRLRYANVVRATMPADIRAESVSVVGLHSTVIARTSHLLMKRLSGARPVVAVATAKPITDATPSPNPNPDPTLAPIVQEGTGVSQTGASYAPYGLAVAYDYPVLHGWDGNGRATGSVIDSDFANSDMNGFIKTFQLPRPLMPTTGDDADTHRVLVDGGTSMAAEGEETLDAEAIVGLSPGTNFYEYLMPQLADFDIINAYNQADTDDVVDVLNSSFGGCESADPSGSYSEDYLALQGAAKGISYSASAGDTGSNGCEGVTNGVLGEEPGVDAPASGYYFTDVGGTAVTLNPNTGAVLNEMSWTDGGGGVSQIDPLPDWQTTTIGAATPDSVSGTAATPAQNSGRNVPDLALFAASQDFIVAGGGFSFYYQGALTSVAGTSLSSPLWTSMQTQIDEVEGTRNGWVNPRLYAIYNTNGYAQFRDITQGNNGAYTAVPGYDNTTGIGAPLGYELSGTE